MRETTPPRGGQAAPLFFTYFFLYATLGAYLPYSGLFLSDKGLSGSEIGAILGILPFCKMALVMPWIALMIRSANRNRFVIITVIISTISIASLALAASFPALLAANFFFALMRSGFMPVVDTMAVRYSAATGGVYGRLRIGGSFGFIITSLIAGKMIDLFGSEGLVAVAAVSSLLSIFPVSKLDLGWANSDAGRGIRLKMSRRMMAFYGAVALYGATFSFHSNFFSIMIGQAGEAQFTAGLMWSAGIVIEVSLMYVSGSIMRVISARTLIIISILLAVVRYGVYAESASVPLLYAVSLLHGFTFGTFHVGALRYVQRMMPDEVSLKAQSLYSIMTYGLGTIAGSLLSGVFFDLAGTRAVFLAAAGFSLVSALIVFGGADDGPGRKHEKPLA